ncbi:anticodon-binding domain-containing protein [Thamnocephalis sphaerospora]|uniref:Anticodon-binding domain-containing protein n=1 Tax=Thamnocephalis sphaerospora TaxID=78915 RepID=A0A4P9XH48_9FUNG|nr:anticodon-binding domain-containing protein [Thamnocephalis sphaerospora]|eukprot:RKP04977.1 anticodon-binding domain-containing protein [Thamnocephalis sphaerospora]
MSTRAASSAASSPGTGSGISATEHARGALASSAWTIGQQVRVKTTIGETIEGRIFAYDIICGSLVIDILFQVCTAGHLNAAAYWHWAAFVRLFRIAQRGLAAEQADARPDYTIVKLNFLQNITLLKPPTARNGAASNTGSGSSSTASSPRPDRGMPTVGPLPLDRLRAREAKAIKEAHQAEARRGVGVDKEAQDIFDALSKTLPCRWHEQTIVVLDEVLVEPPYTVESCKANASSSSSLARVKKLEGERKRLKL